MTAAPQHPLQDWIERRKAMGISLRQIGDLTKISVRYLEAIERGAFDKLPGGAYTEGYIRQYARAVGDNENRLWNYYRSVFGPVQPNPSAPEPGSAVCRLRAMIRSWFGRGR